MKKPCNIKKPMRNNEKNLWCLKKPVKTPETTCNIENNL